MTLLGRRAAFRLRPRPLASRLLVPRLLVVAVPALLAACAGGAPAPASYAPLRYGYLPKLALNVGAIDVQDALPPPPPGDIADRSPETPAAALEQMAHDRLSAQGATGQAVFVIDQASIVRGPDGTLDGALKVHLEIDQPDGARSGYAEASVTRQSSTTASSLPLRTRLYDLTKRMVDDMNVEFEYQTRRSLGPWMVSNTAPVAAPVQQQPLPPAGTAGAVAPGVPLAPGPDAAAAPGYAAPAGAPGYNAPGYNTPGASPVPAPPAQSYTPPGYAPPSYAPPSYAAPSNAPSGYTPPNYGTSGVSAPGYTPLSFPPSTSGPPTTAAPGFSGYTPPSYPPADASAPSPGATPSGMSPPPGYLGLPAGRPPS